MREKEFSGSAVPYITMQVQRLQTRMVRCCSSGWQRAVQHKMLPSPRGTASALLSRLCQTPCEAAPAAGEGRRTLRCHEAVFCMLSFVQEYSILTPRTLPLYVSVRTSHPSKSRADLQRIYVHAAHTSMFYSCRNYSSCSSGNFLPERNVLPGDCSSHRFLERDTELMRSQQD